MPLTSGTAGRLPLRAHLRAGFLTPLPPKAPARVSGARPRRSRPRRGEGKRRPCAGSAVRGQAGSVPPDTGPGGKRHSLSTSSTATYFGQAGPAACAQPAAGGAPDSGLGPGPAAAHATPSKAITKPAGVGRKGGVLVSLTGSSSHPA